MESLAGRFLVASPHLPDENFFRTVVLVIQHDDGGAYGLVLNRPTRHRLGEVLPWGDELGKVAGEALYWGGPVDGPLMALHTDPTSADVDVLPGLYVAVNRDKIHQLLGRSDVTFRIYNGYAGWGPGQLDGEMEMGGWLCTAATVEGVFSDPEDLWRRVVSSIGREILRPTLGKALIPDDPSLN